MCAIVSVSSNHRQVSTDIRAGSGRSGSLPDDLAVTDFDDTLVAKRLWPPLTVVRQPIEDMAFRATHKLLLCLHHPERALAFDEIVPFEIIERLSTAARG